MKPIDRILCKAEDMGMLPVESNEHGLNYVFDPYTRRVLIMALHGKDRHAVIISYKAIREMNETMEVLA